jgi:hypothetical protein
VLHGRDVETHDGFFCEAVWPGEFAEAGFPETDIVAGTGAAVAQAAATFVSSASTVDRLVSFSRRNCAFVSNSLPCLLATLEARVDPTYRGYYADFYSVVEGLSRYKRQLATSAGDLELCYFDNLQWDGRTLRRVPKPFPQRDFSSFTAYRAFLAATMNSMARNANSPRRARQFRMLGTFSTGYDSPTVAALASEVGCNEAICFDKAHTGEPDSGAAIADSLGIRPITVPDAAWRKLTMPEVPFLASNAMGEEVRFSGAAQHLGNRLLLTGYHGDKMWDPHTKALSTDVVRGDPSGLALSEYRLWTGFIHCPVPFWGVRQIADINRISRSSEMASWNVDGDYSRPICRQIVEAKGVPREAFGQKKRNASVMIHNYPELLTPGSTAEFLAWLRSRRGEWIKRGRIPPLPLTSLDSAIHRITDSLADWTKNKPGLWRISGKLAGQPTYLRRLLFSWAVERATERYLAAMPGRFGDRSAPTAASSETPSAPQIPG